MPTRSAAAKTGVAGLFSLLVAIALLWLFAPTTLGGSFAYVVVNGNSMSPRLKTDDIVLLRRASDYEVGDAIAYRHPQIGTVFHRIVADDGERFTLRGDNREGEDSYQPTREDVIAGEWFAIPNGGRVVRELQRPRNLALLIGSTVLLGVAGGASSGKLRRAGIEARRRAPRSKRDLSAFSQSGRQTLVLGVALALGSGTLLALFALNGSTREDSEAVPFEERGAFSYGGPVTGGVYDGDELAAPEPLYRQLVDELPLRFSYDLTTSAPDAAIENVIGTYELVAEVSLEDGWTRTFQLHPSTRFASGQFEATTSLDLAAIEAELATVAELTGVAAGRHPLRVIALVEASGQLDGRPFERSYEHRVQFHLTELALQFDGTPEALVFTETGSVSRPTTVPRVLDVPMIPLSLEYGQFPVIGAAGLGLATVLLFAVGKATLTTRRRGEAARIGATYGALLVEVAEERAAFTPRPHDVSRFADLVRLAAAEGLAVMHRPGLDDDEYFVSTSDRSWRYSVRKPITSGVASGVGVDGRYITTGES